MKTVDDYRNMMLTVLGDASGRRYSEDVLDMGLREALIQVNIFCPFRENVYGAREEAPGLHTIKGLDGARMTTIPDPHMLTVVRGASGYAMRIRARSVTEVFGKRPEDGENLIRQSETLISEFLAALTEAARMESYRYDPWPAEGFNL